MENLIPYDEIIRLGFLGRVILLGILAISIWVLSKGADMFVEGSARLAYRLGISKIVIGATIVSIGTTAPEAAVSILSAAGGNPGLALGNAVGSVICNAGLIFGFGCMISAIPIDKFIIKRHGRIQLGCGIILILFVLISFLMYGKPIITQWMGFLLINMLIIYLAMSIHWARKYKTEFSAENIGKRSVLFYIGLIAFGLVLVIMSSKVLISDVKQICIILRIPESIISATFVAFGTSLPEFVTAIASIKKKHQEILVGNILGANILNVLFVIGVSASISALEVPPEFLRIHLPVMIIILFVFIVFSSVKKRKYNRFNGLVLLGIYLIFILLAFVFGIKS